MADKVCLVTGVGPGTGAALARRFGEGYAVAMLARKAERLAELEKEIPGPAIVVTHHLPSAFEREFCVEQLCIAVKSTAN